MKPWIAAALSALTLQGCVSGLFFHPDQKVYAQPAQYGLSAQDVWFEAQDGSRLHGWWFAAPGPAAKGTIVHAHGNAANISNHLPLVAWLPAQGYNVLTFDYRGFGSSQGSASLDGVVADVRSAVAFARGQAGADPQRLAVLGQSLGGATAIRAVAQDHAGVRLLIVDSGFDSYRGIAMDAVRGSFLVVPAAIASLSLPWTGKDPRTAMASLEVPVLILHGEQDQVVPVEHGQRLFDLAHGPRKIIRIPGGRHVDALMRPDVRQHVLEALDRYVAGTPETVSSSMAAPAAPAVVAAPAAGDAMALPPRSVATP